MSGKKRSSVFGESKIKMKFSKILINLAGNEGSSSRCVCLESRRIEDNNIRNFQKINFILIRKIKFSKILISVVKNQETNQERRKFFASMRLESKITVRNLRNSKILINLISGNEDR